MSSMSPWVSLPPKETSPTFSKLPTGYDHRLEPAQGGQVGLAVRASTSPLTVALGMTLESLSRKSLGTD